MKKANSLNTQKVARLGMYLCLAVLLGYVEALIPLPFFQYGIKLGLANVIIVLLLYVEGKKEAVCISVLRTILIASIFGNGSMLLYSLVGALFSLTVMILFLPNKKLSVLGISMLGGIFHNLGQLVVAMTVFRSSLFMWYIPALLLSGVLAGLFIGLVVKLIYPKVKVLLHATQNSI